jgi:triphosphoribosyl-dephospho-CoA synthase
VQTETIDARAAFLRACSLDVLVRKPGNVSVASPGHGMTAALFLASAAAAADALCAPGATVGARIEGAVARSLSAAGCNTNLGIVLLCAPLAAALERAGNPPVAVAALQSGVRDVLAALDLDDARCAFRAIAAANPGGLGHAPVQDVAQTPTVDLRAAMQLAAHRDSIARQYASDFADIFDFGLARVRTAPASIDPVLFVYLSFLANSLDSHIVRKHGTAVAQSVTESAMAFCTRAFNARDQTLSRDLEIWDDELKQLRINPGTSADLTAATLFVAGLIDLTASAAAPRDVRRPMA